MSAPPMIGEVEMPVRDRELQELRQRAEREEWDDAAYLAAKKHVEELWTSFERSAR